MPSEPKARKHGKKTRSSNVPIALKSSILIQVRTVASAAEATVTSEATKTADPTAFGCAERFISVCANIHLARCRLQLRTYFSRVFGRIGSLRRIRWRLVARVAYETNAREIRSCQHVSRTWLPHRRFGAVRIYSSRNAFTGSRLAAKRAGSNPAATHATKEATQIRAMWPGTISAGSSDN
jgi:hypothetical protein